MRGRYPMMDNTAILALVGFVLFACAILAHTLPIVCERSAAEWEDTSVPDDTAAAAAAAPSIVDDGATIRAAASQDDE